MWHDKKQHVSKSVFINIDSKAIFQNLGQDTFVFFLINIIDESPLVNNLNAVRL